MQYTSKYTTCPSCHERKKPFRENSVVNAWTKDGFEWYEFECRCGQKIIMKVAVVVSSEPIELRCE